MEENEYEVGTIGAALENAITLLESLGYKSGDIHDDLALALSRMETRFPRVLEVVL